MHFLPSHFIASFFTINSNSSKIHFGIWYEVGSNFVFFPNRSPIVSASFIE